MTEFRNTVKVFVHSPSESVSRNVLTFFDNNPLIELVGVEVNKQLAPQTLAKAQPDLLLVSLEPHDRRGRELLREIAQALPHCKAIVITDLAGRDRRLGARPLNGISGKADTSIAVDKNDYAGLRAAIETSIEEKDGGRRSSAQTQAANKYPATERPPTVAGASEHNSSGAMRKLADRRRGRIGRRCNERNRSDSSNRFRTLVEQLPGLPYIASVNANASMVYVSPRINEVLGFTPAEWCDDAALRFGQIHPDDRARLTAAIQKAIAEKGAYSIDYRIHHRNGGVRWFHDEARVMVDRDNDSLLLQGVMLDVTERKQAQEELEKSHGELQQLIAALDAMRAEEQRRLAQDMHDDFGQLLAAMKLDLSTLQQHIPRDDAESVRYLSSINDLVDSMVTSVRRIIADLPPKLVEDLGLFSALTSLAGNFKTRHRIDCRVRISGQEPEFDTRQATALYRIVQEALNNVVKHSAATQVEVRIDCTDDQITLSVADNGKGLAPSSLHKANSCGLTGIRERAASFGGELKIETGPREGTRLCVQLPLSLGH